MKDKFEFLGLAKEQPAIHAMICYITESYLDSTKRGKGITFEEFLTRAVWFFSQRKKEEGLSYIY